MHVGPHMPTIRQALPRALLLPTSLIISPLPNTSLRCFITQPVSASLSVICTALSQHVLLRVECFLSIFPFSVFPFFPPSFLFSPFLFKMLLTYLGRFFFFLFSFQTKKNHTTTTTPCYKSKADLLRCCHLSEYQPSLPWPGSRAASMAPAKEPQPPLHGCGGAWRARGPAGICSAWGCAF